MERVIRSLALQNEASSMKPMRSKKIIYTTSETEFVIHPQLTFTFITTTHQNFRSYTSCKNKNLLAEGY
jgi:hypothetical protein